MILAQALVGPAPRYEFATLGPWADNPNAAIIAALAGSALLAAIALLYWRERSSLSPAAMLPLLVLRVGAVVGLVLYGLAPEKRAAREETQPSRVTVLVDDSLSMSLANDGVASSDLTRAEAAVRLLEEGLLDTLRKQHEVLVAPTSDVRSGAVFPMVGQRDAAPAEAENTLSPPIADALAPRRAETRLGAIADALAPRRAETRLGDAIEQSVALAAGGPLAGVVLVSDGQSNAGASPELVAGAAGVAGTPLFTIGLGSETTAKNVLVRELIAPARAYPKDEIQLAAVIEQQGYDEVDCVASLFVRRSESSDEELLETRTAANVKPSAPLPVDFKVRPEQPGGYVYRISVKPVPGEQKEEDNAAEAEVQVVDRLLKTLIIAGGPTRDYHFLRDQLRRDDSFMVDVWLQSAPPSAVQDAEHMLAGIPEDEEDLGEYDLFVALDADWTRVSHEATEALSRCVSQRGAGLLFATGAVNTPRWLRENRGQSIVALLPVRPAAAPLLLGPTEASAATPARIKLTRAGQEASALWVLGDQQSSVTFWEEELPGFYTTAKVDAVKPGAVVYAEAVPVGDPGGENPLVVFAEQFYGAGRCFYIGAPEIWRLRSESTAAMRAFYTKLLQHLAQGRLLADSPAGSLLFERDRYNVGQTLTLRATLTPAAAADLDPAKPLDAQLELPDGTVQTLRLRTTEAAPSVWTAGVRAESEGAYRATLSLAVDDQPLSAKTQVLVPALERSQTQRNAKLLAEIAEQGGGRYYPTLEAVLQGGDQLPPLPELLVSRSETIVIYGAPDERFARQAARWLLGLIAGCLLLEWICRRAMGLA
ncbi:hypothetical protein Pla123a_26120 [Posidoniimonas polymericola]|uniref:VWFA domain-containing protein n=1 Tax=Posidoniimonas polymericola TaxID=2528002 RepID=A0A5C5YLW7_9BACT|nr:VWA domain-containing protein [Posidoniimonas polymericola]TWT75830.1 hypothetical protein Pla123a_26120 [Posidoniimonas polymericola]